MIDKILNRIWKEKEPNTIIDSSFIENVVRPAMEEYVNERLKELNISDIISLFDLLTDEERVQIMNNYDRNVGIKNENRL